MESSVIRKNWWKQLFLLVLVYFGVIAYNCEGRNILFIFWKFSMSCLLVHFHCKYLVYGILQYSHIANTLRTIFYCISVHICVMHIIVVFLKWHKYSAPPSFKMKLVSSTASRIPLNLNGQWRLPWSGICYHFYFCPNLVSPIPYLQRYPTIQLLPLL